MNKDFKVYKLGDVTKIFAGGDKPVEYCDVKTGDYKYPIYANGETNSGLQGFAKVAKVNEPAVTVSARGTIGFAALRMEPFVPIVRLLTLIPEVGKIDLLYLFYYLKLYRQAGIGSNQAQLIAPDISNRVIALPSLSIQKSISKALSVLDTKIELNNRINLELEAMAKTIYDYWFVQFDFPDKNGKPYKSSGGKMVWNEVLKREIPEGWEVKKIKDIADTGSGGTPLSTKIEFYENGDIPWLNSGEVNSSFIIHANKFITEEGLNNSSAKIFPKGTILVAMYGATAGQVSLMDFEACTNQAICAILPNDNRLIPYLKFGLHQLYQYLINLSSGSARDNLSQDKIRDLLFVIPDDRILTRFHEIASSLFDKILINLKENQQLACLRDWLLPMLMNGQMKIQ